MKVLVTGVAGQLGHDVMNELAGRGYEGIGSDIQEVYSGIQDGTAVTSMPYVQMDITDAACVKRVISEAAPDAVVHCAAWTAGSKCGWYKKYCQSLQRAELQNGLFKHRLCV